jgi:hypothetical protein
MFHIHRFPNCSSNSVSAQSLAYRV